MFTLIGRAYIAGIIFGATKKLIRLSNKNFFTPEENKIAEKTVGKLYSCRPIDSVFLKDAVPKLQKMLETDNLRGMLKLARDETVLSEKPWCVSSVVSALSLLTMRLPSMVYEATTAYKILFLIRFSF
jgi:hypothetical protein